MFQDMENLKILNILKNETKSKNNNIYRDNNVIVVRLSGCVRYRFSNVTYDIKPNEAIFIPKGETYNLSKLSEKSEYVSIKFDADLSKVAPSACSVAEFEHIDELANIIADLWRFGNKAEYYRCYSLFYSLISFIEARNNLSLSEKKKSKIILPAIKYLNKHIYDCELKIVELNKLCGISSVYFNKIFIDNYGMSPQKFIISKRLSHAKAVIDSGDFDTISDVAKSVGYNDPLYFSRAFKKKYGTSPVKYASIHYDT